MLSAVLKTLTAVLVVTALWGGIRYQVKDRTYLRVKYDVAKSLTYDFHHATQGWPAELRLLGLFVLWPVDGALRTYVKSIDESALRCALDAAYLRQWSGIRETPYFGSYFELGMMSAGYARDSTFLNEECVKYERAGLVPLVGDPDFGVVTLLYRVRTILLYAFASMAGVCLGLIALAITIIWRVLKVTGPVNVSAPVCPFDKATAKVSFLKWVDENPLVIIDGDGHETMALVRRKLEQFCQNFLYRYTTTIRDIGGSLTRNVGRGKRLHICFPNITSMDKHLLHNNIATCKNDVHEHRMQECNRKDVLGYMSYVDFHISASDLADYIRAPTLVVTHRFQDWLGTTPHKFFPKNNSCEGECMVSASMVHMTTRGGTTYSHGYHLWQDEGVIIGRQGALTYHKLGDYGESIVLLLQPTSGTFPRDDPYQLRSTSDAKEVILSSGTTVTRGAEYFTFSLHNGSVYEVLITTMMRIVIVMTDAKRDNAYIGNLSATMRARFSADHQPMAIIDDAMLLAFHLCDKTALKLVGQHNLFIDDIYQTGFVQRQLARLLMYCWSFVPAFSVSMGRSMWLWMVGTSRESSWLPWVWNDVFVPNYEVITPVQRVKITDPQKKVVIKPPFRKAGQTAAAPIDAVNKRSSSKHTGKRCHKLGNKSVKANNRSASGVKPQCGTLVTTLQSAPKAPSVPSKPLPAVVKYALRWIRANFKSGGGKVAGDVQKALSKKPNAPAHESLAVVLRQVRRVDQAAASDLTDALRGRANRIDEDNHKRFAKSQSQVAPDVAKEQQP